MPATRSEALLAMLTRDGKVNAVDVEAHYINLRHRTDRRQAMETRLRSAGVSAARLEARLGAEADTASVALTWDSTVNAKYDTSTVAHTTLRMSDGERGCAASHLELWRRCAARPDVASPLLILEDDTVLCADFRMLCAGCVTSVQRAFPDPATRFVAVFLGARVAAWREGGESELDVSDTVGLREADYLWWAGCYLLWPAAARRLLALLPLWAPVDVALSEMTLRRRLRAFVPVPMLAWAAHVHMDEDGVLRLDPDSDILHTNAFAPGVELEETHRAALERCQDALSDEDGEGDAAGAAGAVGAAGAADAADAAGAVGAAAAAAAVHHGAVAVHAASAVQSSATQPPSPAAPLSCSDALMRMLERRKRAAARHAELRGQRRRVERLHAPTSSGGTCSGGTCSGGPCMALQAVDRMWLQYASYHGFACVMRHCSAATERAIEAALAACVAGPYAYLAGVVADDGSCIVIGDGGGNGRSEGDGAGSVSGSDGGGGSGGNGGGGGDGSDDDSDGSTLERPHGVEFAVAEAACLLPADADSEDLLYSLSDLHSQHDVARGRAPLLAVRLTHFRDGGAVLAVSVAHVAMDGGALSRFLHVWASVSRGGGEALLATVAPPAPTRRIADGTTVRTTNGMGDDARHAAVPPPPTPDETTRSAAYDAKSALRTSQLLRDYSEGSGPRRFCVTLPCDLVRQIKARASPAASLPATSPGLECDEASRCGGADATARWITTQEAIAAHMLRVLWGACGDVRQPKARVIFWLDGRYRLGGTADAHGNWTVLHTVTISRADGSLRDIAREIHEGLAALTAEAVRAQLTRYERLGAPVVSSRLEDAAHTELLNADDDRSYGYTLRFNNLSKMPLPMFGSSEAPDSAKGPVQLLATAGPTVLLPSPDGGIRIFLNHEEQSNDALGARRSTAVQVRAALLAPP